jgi:hypothetical protein
MYILLNRYYSLQLCGIIYVEEAIVCNYVTLSTVRTRQGHLLISIPYTKYSHVHFCWYINITNTLEAFVGVSPLHAKHIISNIVELYLSRPWLSG